MSEGFTVVIPLFNKAAYIERALQSVLSQTVPPDEIIVVDDGSTDDGPERVKNIGGDRVLLIRKENAGASSARNRGIEEAKYGIIAFLDSDDAWHADYLETILRLIRNYPYAGAYATAYDVVTRLGYRRKAIFRGIEPEPWEGIIPCYFKAVVLGEPPVSSSTVSIRRNVFNDVGLFLLSERYGEDLDMWGRIALKYPIAFSSAVKATYYQNSINRKSVRPKISRESCFIDTGKKALQEKTLTAEDAYYLEEFLAVCQLRRIRECVLNGNRAVVKKLLTDTHTRLFVKRKLFWSLLSYVPKDILNLLIRIRERAQMLRHTGRLSSNL